MSRPEPLQPVYDFSLAPNNVGLLQGAAEVSLKNEKFTGTAELLLRFMPDCRALFHATTMGEPESDLPFSFFVNQEDEDVSFTFDGQAIKGFTGRWNVNSDTLTLDWIPEIEPFSLCDMQQKNSAFAIFHLFNFPDFRGGLQQESAPAGCALMVLESDEWKITIQALPNGATRQSWERINSDGGCFLTHVVKMERKDGKCFSGKDASEQCHLLDNFLSFVIGAKCTPVCGVGFDAAGTITWKNFASPRTPKPPYSWFNPFQASQAEILFPLFAKRWQQSEEWKDCLHSAIYWYLQANTRGGSPSIDAAIILAQAALERLAHHHLVVDRKMISPEGLDRLKASDRLRLLFSSLNIPVEICASTPEIEKAAPSFKWLDAPHAITDIRNELIHPASKRKVHDCYIDAWKLSLWYLELSLLAMCGYDDTYTNRLTARYVTDSERVPWGRQA